MKATADLLVSLEAITYETQRMIAVLDDVRGASPADRREAKRRVLEIRGRAQELIEWLSEAGIEEARN